MSSDEEPVNNPAIDAIESDSSDSDESEYGNRYELQRKEEYKKWWEDLEEIKMSPFDRFMGIWSSVNSCRTPQPTQYRHSGRFHSCVTAFGVLGPILLVGYFNGIIKSFDFRGKDFIKKIDYDTGFKSAVRYILTDFAEYIFIAVGNRSAAVFNYVNNTAIDKAETDSTILAMAGNSKPVLLADAKQRVLELKWDLLNGVRLDVRQRLDSYISRMVELRNYDPICAENSRPVLCTWGSFAAILNLGANSRTHLGVYIKRRFPNLEEFNSVKYKAYGNNLFHAEVHDLVYHHGTGVICVTSLFHFNQAIEPTKLMINSGVIRNFSIHENLLVVLTSSDEIEIFDATYLRKTHHFRPNCTATKTIFVNGTLILGTKEGNLVSFLLNDSFTNRCCLHCINKFPKENYFQKICRHFLPPKPY